MYINLSSLKPVSIRHSCIQSQVLCKAIHQGSSSGQRNYWILISTAEIMVHCIIMIMNGKEFQKIG